MKISVIIPIYNAEKFLSRCLDSIINQDYKNLEILLVNDGSTDNSLAILEEYKSKDSRIQILNQENKGVSAARNNGVKLATGDFISFVDSDDFLELNMYSYLINLIKTHNLDICSFKLSRSLKVNNEEIPDTISIKNKYEATNISLKGIYVGPCSSLFKKTCVENVTFPEGRGYEDVATTFKFFNNAERIGYIEKKLYHYVYNPHSSTQSAFNSTHRYDYILSCMDRVEFAINNNYIDALPFCIKELLQGCLSCLTALYAEATPPKYSPYYPTIQKLIYTYKTNIEAVNMLNTKYRLLLNSFEKYPFLHKLTALISKWQKSRKK